MPYSPVHQSLWTVRLLQIGHLAVAIATMLFLVTVIVVLKDKPADTLAWSAIIAADIAIVLAGLLIIRAYRSARPVREIVGLLLFSLAVAHLAGYLLLTHFQSLAPLREFLVAQRIL